MRFSWNIFLFFGVGKKTKKARLMRESKKFVIAYTRKHHEEAEREKNKEIKKLQTWLAQASQYADDKCTCNKSHRNSLSNRRLRARRPRLSVCAIRGFLFKKASTLYFAAAFAQTFVSVWRTTQTLDSVCALATLSRSAKRKIFFFFHTSNKSSSSRSPATTESLYTEEKVSVSALYYFFFIFFIIDKGKSSV